MKGIYVIGIILIFTALISQLMAKELITVQEMMNMTLQELMNIEIRTGTLTDVAEWEIPVAITTINKQDIALSPANNLLDLLEIYVPGFTYVEHFMGPRMGLRGILGDQNYSFLLLVNGNNSNLKYDHGPFFEILNKDLSEIIKIEVVRGPGSVTYGPGAIAGIINIITIPNESSDSMFVGFTNNIVYGYNKYNAYSAYTGVNFQSALNFSYSKSEGNKNTRFWYTDRAHGYGYGYMGPEWGNAGLGSSPPSYLQDYQESPEIKLQYTAKLWNDLVLNSRYTTTNHTYTTQSQKKDNDDIFNGILAKQVALDLSYKKKLSDKFEINSAVNFNSADICEYRYWSLDDYQLDHIAQKGLAFAENEINANFQINYNISDNIELALGSEYVYEYYTPRWGYEDKDFLMSFQPPIRFTVLDTASGFYQAYNDAGLVTVIEKDIDSYMYSFFSEAHWQINPHLNLLVSARLDDHELADPALSPRIAISSPLNEQNILKLNWQKSVRLPVFSNLFSQQYLDTGISEFEELQGIELAYQRMQSEKLFFYANAYYNEIDQFSWIPETSSSGLAGNLDLAGLELELLWKSGRNKFGLNYAFIKQINWESTFNDTAWITGLNGEVIYIEDNADNRINNLPAHLIKAHWNKALAHNLLIHLDTRIALDYQQKDMLDIFSAAHQEYGNPVTIEEMENLKDAMEDEGYAQASFTSSMGLSWKKTLGDMEFETSIFARNLLSYNQLRYIIQYWETGNLRQYPRQCGFIKEPLDISLQLTLKF